mmetsp:Transcript_26654/g.43625  ORF Transcript_26654/g.43625 Transcript_26654/m.43625 type:complete len:298 (+) Transcript_26654:291-1184(+)
MVIETIMKRNMFTNIAIFWIVGPIFANNSGVLLLQYLNVLFAKLVEFIFTIVRVCIVVSVVQPIRVVILKLILLPFRLVVKSSGQLILERGPENISRQRVSAFRVKQTIVLIIIHDDTTKTRFDALKPPLLMWYLGTLFQRVCIVIHIMMCAVHRCVVSIVQPSAVHIDGGKRIARVSGPIHTIDTERFDIVRSVPQLMHQCTHINIVDIQIDHHHIVKIDMSLTRFKHHRIQQHIAVHHKPFDTIQFVAKSRIIFVPVSFLQLRIFLFLVIIIGIANIFIVVFFFLLAVVTRTMEF